MNFLDVSTSVVIVLFILSIMTEKITQLVKSYPKVFNLILLILSLALIFRRFYILYIERNSTTFVQCIFATIIVIANGLLILSTHRLSNKKSTFKATIFTLITANLIAITINKFNIYIVIASVTIWSCLTSLHIVPSFRVSFGTKTFDTFFFKNINKRSALLSDNIQRSEEISSLSIIVGFIVAYIFNGNFLNIINRISSGQESAKKNGIQFDLGWSKFPFEFTDNYFAFEKFTFEVKSFLGLLLTGFFLSFGSKFFHDLLETLFYAKKANIALSDPRTFAQSTPEAVQTWVENYSVDDFYYKNYVTMINHPNCNGLGIGSVTFNGATVKGIRIFSTHPASSIQHYLPEGNTEQLSKRIPYQVFQVSGLSTLTSFTLGASDSVSNIDRPSSQGSLGFPVIVKKTGTQTEEKGNFFITCYHVVKHPEHLWTAVNLSKRDVVNSGRIVVGKIIAGSRSQSAEVAIVKLKENLTFGSPFYPDSTIRIRGHRTVTEQDLGIPVYMFSRMENRKKVGTLKSHDFAETIDFGDLQEPEGFLMYKLIEVQDNNMPIQSFGDSGNLLFDELNYAIGIVFAKNDRSSFAMRIDYVFHVFKKFNLDVNLKIA